jgi:hypothetical protein
MLLFRNQAGLSAATIAHCREIWELLGGNSVCEFECNEAHNDNTQTRFVENSNVVVLGADVLPGKGTIARSRMSLFAYLAHELAHAERFRDNYDRPTEPPDSYLDEAEASIRASFKWPLGYDDRIDLVQDAHDQIGEWLRFIRETQT